MASGGEPQGQQPRQQRGGRAAAAKQGNHGGGGADPIIGWSTRQATTLSLGVLHTLLLFVLTALMELLGCYAH